MSFVAERLPAGRQGDEGHENYSIYNHVLRIPKG